MTIDVHDSDTAEDVRIATEFLASRQIRATFFVPSALLTEPAAMVDALRALPLLGHEVGSHSLHHDWREIDALARGKNPQDLAFLAVARTAFEDLYGFSPTVFRSPIWCHLNDLALDELVRLGYLVDSSATPQRMQMLGSRPFGPGWFLSRRSPHLIRPQLLEVPTTTVILPAGSTTFRMLRRFAPAFLRMLYMEARVFRDRVVVLQFDSRDLNPAATRLPRLPLDMGDFVPRQNGGLGLRGHFVEYDPVAVATIARGILDLLPNTSTLSEVRTAWLNRRGPRAAT